MHKVDSVAVMEASICKPSPMPAVNQQVHQLEACIKISTSDLPQNSYGVTLFRKEVSHVICNAGTIH